jgi:hypothetical protein
MSCIRCTRGYIDSSDNDFLQQQHLNSCVVGLPLNMSKLHLLHPYVFIIHEHFPTRLDIIHAVAIKIKASKGKVVPVFN